MTKCKEIRVGMEETSLKLVGTEEEDGLRGQPLKKVSEVVVVCLIGFEWIISAFVGFGLGEDRVVVVVFNGA